MTADCTDDNLINLEGLDGSYTLMNAGDGREPRDDEQPFSHADEEHLWVTSDVDDEDESDTHDIDADSFFNLPSGSGDDDEQP